MHCTKCGFEIREGDRFCSRCGNRIGALSLGPDNPRPLMLDKRNKKIAGVCAGFARYLGADVVLVRVLTLAVAICTGVGFFVYLAAWIVIPSDNGLEPRELTIQAPQTN